MNNPLDGWTEWSRYILKELERLNVCYEHLDEKVTQIITDIAMLKVKATIGGACAGGVLSIISGVIIWFLTKK